MYPIPVSFENTIPDLRGPHLVSTGLYDKSNIALFIHKEGKELKRHLCYAFYFEDHESKVSFDNKAPSPVIHWIEHGRFYNRDLFAKICRNQPVLNQSAPNQTAEQVFADWRTAVLTTLEADHSALWVPFVAK